MRTADHPFNSEGVWCEILTPSVRGRPALFLDRDGVIVEDTHYLCRAEDMTMIPGAATVLTAANQRGVAVVIVTNQAGIGRGYYGWAEFKTVQDAIHSALRAEGARVDAVYACAHHPAGQGEFAHPDHPARKPNPGMLLQAARDLQLDLKNSWLVGDRATDVEAARRAGLAGALLVATGYGNTERRLVDDCSSPAFQVRFGRLIAEAMTLPLLSPKDSIELNLM